MQTEQAKILKKYNKEIKKNYLKPLYQKIVWKYIVKFSHFLAFTCLKKTLLNQKSMKLPILRKLLAIDDNKVLEVSAFINTISSESIDITVLKMTGK